jgi:carbonic anhydrase
MLRIEEVYVVKHTRCGHLGATNEMVHTAMKANLGADKAADVDSFEALPIANWEQSAHDDIEYLRNHSLAPSHVKVTG